MNQILYKGYTFGGVGEDVTNKQYDDVTIHNPITDQDETYTPVGGENAEIFNSYKDKNGQLPSEDIRRNIATGKYSTISGKNNKELTEQGKNSQYNTIVGKNNININGQGSFVGGLNNFVQNGNYCLIYGSSNIFQGRGYCNGIIGSSNKIKTSNDSVYQNFITGSGNIIEDSTTNFVCGEGNTLKNNQNGGIFVQGRSNEVSDSYMGIVSGMSNKVEHAQFPAVFGQYNIIEKIAAGAIIAGKQNEIYGVDSGCAVFGTHNKVGKDNQWCDNGTLVCGDRNTVGSSHGGTIVGGVSNTVLSYDEGIIAGHDNNVHGSDNLICGSYITSDSGQSLIVGSGINAQRIYSSIIGSSGGTINGAYGSIIFSRSNSIADLINYSLAIIDNTKARTIQDSTVNIKNFNLGHTANYLGLTTEYDFNYSDVLNIVTDFSTVQWTPSDSYDYNNKTFTTNCYIQEVTFASVDIGNELHSYELTPKEYYYWNGNAWIETDQETISSMRFIGYAPYSIQNANVDLINEYTFGTTVSKISASNYDCLQTLNTGTSTGTLQATYLYYNDNWSQVSRVPRLSDIMNSLVIGNNGSLIGDSIKSIILGDENTSIKTEKSIIIGNSNTMQSDTINSIIIGLNNSIQFIESIVLGKNNTIIEGSNNSICLGNSNTMRTSSSDNYCIGDLNSIEQGSNNVFIFGKSNSFSSGAPNNLCLGNSNTLFSAHHIICIGDNNDCEQSSSYNHIFGESNTLNQSSSYNFIIGNNSLATGNNQNSFIIGYSNTAMNGGNQNYIYGYNNITTNGTQYTMLLGYGLKSSGASNNLVIGRYNIDSSLTSGSYTLIVGNGTSDNDRSNALEIKADGSQVITLKDTTVTGLGIGKITITQSNISFESLKENSNQEKETVSFTFEEIQALKNGGGSGPVPAQLEARVSALETTVGDSSSGLVYDVDNLLQLANLDEESYPISFYNGDQTATISTTVTTE